MIKVLFNDSCPICSKEINHYKSLENNINWLDINDLEISTKLSGKSHRELLRRLHVIKDEKVFSGVSAFIIMWENIPKYRWIAYIISTPIIYQVSVIFYEVIALFLFYKNKHQLDEKE